MTYQYGRRPAKNAPALRFRSFARRGAAIPDHPARLDQLSRLQNWQVLGNNDALDCNAVAWANTRRLVTAALSDKENYPDQQQVWEFYRTQNRDFDPCGSKDDNGPKSSADGGMEIQTGLEYLAAQGGPDGVKAVAFATVDPTDLAEVEAAIAIFGSLWLGVVVLEANQQEFSAHEVWTNVLGSKIDGGHAVIAGGYVQDGHHGTNIAFITWGRETRFGPSFWNGSARDARGSSHNLVEEAWIVIWPEHLGTGAFQAGVDLDQLKADYHALTGQLLALPD